MVPLLIGVAALAGPPDRAAVDEVLDALHRAAAEADEQTYWALFAEDAVFVGTDAEERWSLAEFRAFAEPHFLEAPAWRYAPGQREVHFGPKGRVAWFYETLTHARYGEVRGSGALRVDGGRWRLTQYVLSFPIPNDRAAGALAVSTGALKTLPTPFTADAIRGSYQPGYVAVHRTVASTSAEPTWRRTEVLDATEKGVEIRFTAVDEAGEPASEGKTAEFAWTELRDHAAFPVSGTRWEDEVGVQTPAGSFVTRRYTVEAEGRRSTFWFDLSQPGPPVRMQVESGGVVTMQMELVSVGSD